MLHKSPLPPQSIPLHTNQIYQHATKTTKSLKFGKDTTRTPTFPTTCTCISNQYSYKSRTFPPIISPHQTILQATWHIASKGGLRSAEQHHNGVDNTNQHHLRRGAHNHHTRNLFMLKTNTWPSIGKNKPIATCSLTIPRANTNENHHQHITT